MLATGIQGLSSFPVNILNKLETHQMGKLVQHHQNISNPLREQLKVGAFFKALFQTKVSNLLQELHSGNFKKIFFYDFQERK